MPYIDTAYLEDAFPGGSATLKRITRAGSGALDSSIVESAIQAACDEIDTYATGTPGFPWTSTPGQVKAVALSLAVYAVYSRCWLGETDFPASVSAARESALAWLRELRRGTVSAVPLEAAPREDTARRIVSVGARDDLGRNNPRRFALRRWGW